MSKKERWDARGLTSVVITWGFAFLPANLIPALIARLVNDFGMSVTWAGALATGMMLVNSATVILMRGWLSRHNRTPVAGAGVLTLIVVAGLGILFPGSAMFTALLLVSGVGSGLVLGAASASISGMGDPDRSANIAMIFNRLIVAVAYFTLPLIGGSMTAVLLVLAVPGVVVLATVAWLPKPPPQTEESPSPEPLPGVKVAPKSIGGLAWIMAICFGAVAITDDGVVGMAEIIAISRFGDDGSGLFLNMYAIATLGGLCGAVLAPLLTKVLSRAGALAAALVTSLIAKIMMLITAGEALYAGAVVVWGFAFGLSLPLVFGLAAVLKRDGSASVAVNGVYILGVALGPVIAAQLYDFGEETLLAWVMGAVGALAVVIIIVVAAQIERQPHLAEAGVPMGVKAPASAGASNGET